MIQNGKNQNLSHKAFTLIEMVIVLIIMGILLMLTLSLSGDQIQKVKNKAVKESIIAEMQTRYSKNLGSSSFVGNMYSNMDVNLKKGEDKISFKYNVINGETLENTFTDNFEIRYMGLNYRQGDKPDSTEEITLKYSPYKISCEIGDNEENNNLVIVTKINNNRDYCFEIKQKNCRLTEMSEEICNTLKRNAGIGNN